MPAGVLKFAAEFGPVWIPGRCGFFRIAFRPTVIVPGSEGFSDGPFVGNGGGAGFAPPEPFAEETDGFRDGSGGGGADGLKLFRDDGAR